VVFLIDSNDGHRSGHRAHIATINCKSNSRIKVCIIGFPNVYLSIWGLGLFHKFRVIHRYILKISSMVIIFILWSNLLLDCKKENLIV